MHSRKMGQPLFSPMLQLLKSGTSTLESYFLLTCNTNAQEVTSSRARFPKPTREYEVVSVYGPNIIVAEGEEWKKYRKISAPAFSEVRISTKLIGGSWFLVFLFVSVITSWSGMKLWKSWMSSSPRFGQARIQFRWIILRQWLYRYGLFVIFSRLSHSC